LRNSNFKAIAIVVPVGFFYALAAAFHINGDEAAIDFILVASFILSVITSAAFFMVAERFVQKTLSMAA